MIPDRIWTEIESRTFSASLGVVSTPRAFDVALLRQPLVLELVSLLVCPENPSAVFARIQRLLRDPSNDEHYCHPYDLPIAVYLKVLDIFEPYIAVEAADSILEFPNLWWARAMALRVAASPAKRIPVLRKRYRFADPPTGIVWEANTLSSLYEASARIKWQPEVTARLRTNTESSNGSVDLSPVPAKIRTLTIGGYQ